MPELPEIKRYSILINLKCAGKIFTEILSKDPKSPITRTHSSTYLSVALLISFVAPWASGGFSIKAEARGKELRLLLFRVGSTQVDLCIVFTHGLVIN